jgi:hypothetical protein
MTKIWLRLVAVLTLSAVAAAATCPAQAAEEKKRPAKHHAKHAAKKKAKEATAPKAAVAAGAAAGVAAGVAVAKPAIAAKPSSATAAQRLGEAGAWTAYTAGEAASRVCYLVGKPEKTEPAGALRKPPMAMVTHRPAENVANVVSFVEGYLLKEGSEVAVAVGTGKFELFTKDDSAWARTSDLDKSIVAALAKGKRAVVKGQPQKGPATTDIYPLDGFPKALALIDKACGIKR